LSQPVFFLNVTDSVREVVPFRSARTGFQYFGLGKLDWDPRKGLSGYEYAVVVTRGGTVSHPNCERLGFGVDYSKVTVIKTLM
jgi:hypothetical protein